MKIRIDTARCTGHGRCYTLAPAVYGPDDDGHSELVSDAVGTDLHEQARLGARNCPEDAITIDDA